MRRTIRKYYKWTPSGFQTLQFFGWVRPNHRSHYYVIRGSEMWLNVPHIIPQLPSLILRLKIPHYIKTGFVMISLGITITIFDKRYS